MSLNESIVEDAALAMLMATLTPGLSQKERERREAIRRLSPAIPEQAHAAIKRYLRARFERWLNP